MTSGTSQQSGTPILYPSASAVSNSTRLFTNIVKDSSPPTTLSSSTTPKSSDISPTQTMANSPMTTLLHQNGSLSTSAKAGIGIGVALGALATVALIAWFIVRRRNSSRPLDGKASNTEGGGRTSYELECTSARTN